MNPDDPIARTRTHDEGLNAAQQIDPAATAEQLATWAVLINRGLVPMEDIRRMVMLARIVATRPK